MGYFNFFYGEIKNFVRLFFSLFEKYLTTGHFEFFFVYEVILNFLWGLEIL